MKKILFVLSFVVLFIIFSNWHQYQKYDKYETYLTEIELEDIMYVKLEIGSHGERRTYILNDSVEYKYTGLKQEPISFSNAQKQLFHEFIESIQFKLMKSDSSHSTNDLTQISYKVKSFDSFDHVHFYIHSDSDNSSFQLMKFNDQAYQIIDYDKELLQEISQLDYLINVNELIYPIN
jgi:hypothetical protein